jgi:hypothetical protein
VTERHYTREEIEAAKLAVQRKVMIELGGHVGTALVSVTADDEDAIEYLREQEGRK